MHSSWIVLVPPLLVLLVAIIKRNVLLSLLTGIISAALIAKDFSVPQASLLLLCRLSEQAEIKTVFCSHASPDHLFTFAFLIILGIIISLITHTGGIAAYSTILEKKLKDKKTVETTSLLLSLCFFIDDYLNSLTVGSIMRPLTDRFRIPRAKLAFLLDATSAPLCVIIPASSWIALILSQLETSGVSEKATPSVTIYGDPFNAYIHSISYMFYPFFIIISAWFIVRQRISFGPMHSQEQEAEKTGNLFGGKQPLIPKVTYGTSGTHQEGSIIDFIIPIGTFIVSIILCLLYSGGWSMLGGNKTALQAFTQANIFYALFISSSITLIISILLFTIQNKLSFSSLKSLSISGIQLMQNSLLVLLLAWTFGSLLKNDLATGHYLANLLLGRLPAYSLPGVVFITSGLIAAITGSAWGTINIMVPLTIPLIITFMCQQQPILLAQAYLLYPALGGLISGAIAGSHVTSISDATVIASTSAGCYHFDHVITQISYVIPAILGSSLALLISGLFITWGTVVIPLAFMSGLTVTLALLHIRNQNR
jgi:tetracycline resistance efflux pump